MSNSEPIFKKILISISGVLIIQTIAWIWWAATITANMSYLKQDMSDLKGSLNSALNTSYKTTDALKDFAIRDQRMDRIEKDINRIALKKEVI